MQKSAAAPIRIDEEWVDRAGCRMSATRLPPWQWDDEVDGESDLQREVRHRIAEHVCRTSCPVTAECYEHAQRTRRKRLSPGVRGGRLFT